METKDSQPTKNVTSFKRDLAEREQIMYQMLESLMDYYGDMDNVYETSNIIRSVSFEDTVYNKSCNLRHWFLHLINM
jgi:hypothetical protein